MTCVAPVGSVLAVKDNKRPPTPDTAQEVPGETSLSESSRRKKPVKVWLIALGVVALLVIAGAVTVSILNLNRTGQATAQEYFEALAAGDATAANALSNPDTDYRSDATFLTDEVLASATELISDVKVVPASGTFSYSGDDVNVSYTLAGERHTVELWLPQGEPEWGFLQTFEMRRPFVEYSYLHVQGLAAFTLAGHRLDHQDNWLSLFPGVYPVAPADPDFFELKESEVVVDGLGTDVSVTFEPTAALVAEVQAQANNFMDECAQQTETGKADSACPLFVYMPFADSTLGTWEILEYPTIELRAHGSSFMASGGAARFTPWGGGEPVDTYRGIEFGSQVRVIDGKVELDIAQH